jgi:thiosulfate/3-mercaptopyruvate sulfurtransferase
MEKKVLFFVAMFVLFASLFLVGFAQAWHNPPCARTIDPIVSTEWLAANLRMKNLVILDVRSAEDYGSGHIRGSINEPFVVPFSAWITMRDGLLLEVPEASELFKTIGNLGIKADSWVVIVTSPNPGEPPFYGLANGTRVALTLIYAGVKNVAILDGGYPKWASEGKPTKTKPTKVKAGTYTGKTNKAMFVSGDYVEAHIWKSDIIDARDADVYYGATIEPFADKAGHIPSAKCLPAPWIWKLDENGDYLYKDPETLREMASGVIGETWGCRWRSPQEIIVYCGVGGYASSWWFVLTQVLGYENVKFYDGAAQEWVLYYDMVPYQWD